MHHNGSDAVRHRLSSVKYLASKTGLSFGTYNCWYLPGITAGIPDITYIGRILKPYIWGSRGDITTYIIQGRLYKALKFSLKINFQPYNTCRKFARCSAFDKDIYFNR